MAETDDWGGVAVDAQPKADDWGGIPVNEPAAPKLPDTTGVRTMAKDNLAANDNKETTEGAEPKPPQTPSQRLDTAMGMPVAASMGDSNNPLPAAVRGQLVNSYAKGHSTTAGDFMQSALHSVVPIAAGLVHPLDHAENTAKQIGSAYAGGVEGWVGSMAYPFMPKQQQQDLMDSGAVEREGAEVKTPGNPTGPELVEAALKGERTTLGKAMGGLYAPVASILAPVVNPAIDATVPAAEKAGVAAGYAVKIPGAIGVGMDIFGMGGAAHMATAAKAAEARRAAGPQFPPGAGPWDNHPGADVIKEVVAKQMGKDPAAVTSADVDNAIAKGFKDKAPAAQDFVAAAKVMNAEVSTLHNVYKETGVKPDQVFEDARNDPSVAADIADGKVPQAYSHLVEPPVVTPEKAEKLQVAASETGKSFQIVDAEGDHVQGGFDSAEEARHYIEDKQAGPLPEEPPEWAGKEEAKTTTEKTPSEKSDLTPDQKRYKEKSSSDRDSVRSAKQAQLHDLEKQIKPYEDGTYTDLSDEEIAHRDEIRDEINRAKKSLDGYDVIDSMESPRGEQAVIPGAEKITDKQLAERKMEEPLKGGAAPLEGGLFDVAGRGQGDIFDAPKAAEAPKPAQAVSDEKMVAPKQSNVNVVRPAESGRPTSLRTFLLNNGAKFNEGNELLSIKDGAKRITGEGALDRAHQLAKEYGYLPEDDPSKPSTSAKELQDVLWDKNGGREAWRERDADRVAKAEETKRARENMDPSRIEHDAHNAGIDTERLKDETEKQYIGRLLKGLQEFYRGQEGSIDVDAYRKAVGESIKFVEGWAGKLTGGMFEKLGEGYIKTFAPELVGDKAKRADAYMAKFKVAKQEAENSIYRQSEQFKAAWDKVPSSKRMEWLYDHETGRWNEEEDPDHARYEALMDATFKAEKEAIGADAEKGYKENYLPHAWENPDAVKAFFKSDAMIKKYGADWFTKTSAFKLIQEGVRAGFKLRSDNPEVMLRDRLQAGRDMISTMDLLKDMEESGLAKPTRVFSVDKRIAKVTADLTDAQEKYKKASDAINDPKQLRWDFADPAVSKYMKTVEGRIKALTERLEAANKEKADNKLTDAQMKELKTGFKIIGPDAKVWNIHNEIGPLWKNAMESKGLWENQGVVGDAYRHYTASKAIWTAAKLGLSLFHPVHVGVIHLASGIAGAAEHVIHGGSFSDLAVRDSGITMGLGGKETGMNPLARNKEATFGIGRDHPAVAAWQTEPAARTPEQQKMVTTMIEGGFKPTMSARDTIHFKENFDKAIKGVGLNNLRLLGTALQLPGKLMAPFFEHWIPGLKSEVYLRRAEEAVARDPSLANDAGRRGEVFRQISKDTDRTYGEMNNEVQFWNKTLRDSFNAAFISGGWKLAQIYNLRGLMQPGKIAYKFLKTGEFSKDDVTFNMLHAYAYTGLTLALGGAINAMMGNPIGKAKDGVWDMVKNLVAPQTGDKNPDGSPIRLNQPAFAKEAYMLAHDINIHGMVGGTGSFLYHQTLIPGILDTLSNQDFTGRELISDPTDLHQWASAGWDAISPIALSTYARAEDKGSDAAKTAGLLGFPMAGKYYDQTPFEQKVLHTYEEQNPPKNDSYSQKLKGQLKAALADGDSKEIDAVKARMREEGMTDRQISTAAHVFTKAFVDVAWKELPAQDQKRLIESATEEEKKRFHIKH